MISAVLFCPLDVNKAVFLCWEKELEGVEVYVEYFSYVCHGFSRVGVVVHNFLGQMRILSVVSASGFVSRFFILTWVTAAFLLDMNILDTRQWVIFKFCATLLCHLFVHTKQFFFFYVNNLRF